MKTISVVLMGTLLLINMGSCNGQSKKNSDPTFEDNLSLVDTLHKPKIKVKVNKEFDSNGNLMRYDSTYSYVYKGGNIAIHDSLFPFNSFFDMHSKDLFNDKIDFFMNDSILYKNFFEDSFFKKQNELNKLLFDGFYPKIDSLKRNCLNGSYLRSSNRNI